MNFKDFGLLPQSIAALKKQGIHTPTTIQEKAIPPLLDSYDIIAQAQTGSGKTLAFVLPMLEFVQPEERQIQGLVITPTRELANQIVDVIESLAKGDGIRTLAVFGGRSIGPQMQAIKRGVHLVVATPGRLLDLIRRKAIDLRQVQFVVVDEADEMLDRGFAKDLEAILTTLRHDHLTALFSATVPDWVHEASSKYLHDPVRVKVETTPEEQPKIEHHVLTIRSDQRAAALDSLLDGSDSSIVFTRTKHGARKLAKKLAAAGRSVACLQGNMSQNARDRVMRDFRDQRAEILVATNVAARGLDVDHVELVINYELPENAELLTHRVGRTGRMGREGRAVTLISPDNHKKWQQLKRHSGLEVTTSAWKPKRSRRRR